MNLLAIGAATATLIGGVARADTYRFGSGQFTHKGCNAETRAWLADWVARGLLTIGHDQQTLALHDKSYGADEVLDGYAFFTLVPNHFEILASTTAIDCADAHCRGHNITINLIERRDASHWPCYEQWHGPIEALPPPASPSTSPNS